MAKQFMTDQQQNGHDLAGALRGAIGLVLDMKERLGPLLFKDFLALHFSPTRSGQDAGHGEHPLITLVSREIHEARTRGEIDRP